MPAIGVRMLRTGGGCVCHQREKQGEDDFRVVCHGEILSSPLFSVAPIDVREDWLGNLHCAIQPVEFRLVTFGSVLLRLFLPGVRMDQSKEARFH